MSDSMNDGQRRIAETLKGLIVVDAGPGTGKTFTIKQRYMNLVRQPKVAPSDVLLLTFTRNAAQEMKERIIDAMMEEGRNEQALQVQASTFSSFCMNVVLRHPEAVHRFLGVKEQLSRSARLVQNESMNQEFFRQVYLETLNSDSGNYGRVPAIVGSDHKDVYAVVKKLMTLGTLPLPRGWFGEGEAILRGDREWILNNLDALNRPGERGSNLLKGLKKKVEGNKAWPGLQPQGWVNAVPRTILEEAVDQDREDLFHFIHDVYLNFICRSIATNRLNYGLLELFAFIILYSDRQARKESRYPYVMIDEFQDTNELQFMIALLLLEEPNLCAVGDWKQGIYGFRYASIQNITEFEERVTHLHTLLNHGERRVPFPLPPVLHLPLSENYRSHPEIIEASFSALYSPSSKKEELDKEWLDRNVTTLEAKNDQVCQRGRVDFICADNESEQYDAILDKALEYIQDPAVLIADGEGYRRAKLGDIAVLLRNSIPTRALKARADERGIPAYLEGDMEVMSTREGKLLLAWLRYMENRHDPRALATILDNEGCSLTAMERFRDDESEELRDLRTRLEDQRALLLTKKRRISALISAVFEYYGLENDICQSIIGLLSSLHRETLASINDLIRLLENDIKEGTVYPLEKTLQSDAICIQTMHSSKGLEYPIVIAGRIDVASMPLQKGDRTNLVLDRRLGLRMKKEYHDENGMHRIYDDWRWYLLNNLKKNDMDEERRILFVSLSRAKQYLCLSCHRPSEFFLHVSRGRSQHFPPRYLQPPATVAKEDGVRPESPRSPPRRRRYSSHDLAGKTVPAGGKGKEYGRRVHAAAEMLASGKEPDEDLDELPRIREILSTLKGAELMTEAECFLPLQDCVVRGAADLVAVYPDRVEVHDFKTDGNRRNEEAYRVQVSVYAHAAASLGKPVQCFLQYLSQGMTVELETMPLTELQQRADALRTCNHI